MPQDPEYVYIPQPPESDCMYCGKATDDGRLYCSVKCSTDHYLEEIAELTAAKDAKRTA